jgi:hypothetical protein
VLSSIFKWDVAEVGWSAYVYFFINMLLTLGLNISKIRKFIKSHEEEGGKYLGIFGYTIISAMFIWLFITSAFLIYFAAPMPQEAREFIFTAFISEFFKNYWSVMVLAVVSSVSTLFSGKDKKTENHPLLQIGPLLILSFFMFMAQGIIHSHNIFIRFAVFIFAFFPFRHPDIDSKSEKNPK